MGCERDSVPTGHSHLEGHDAGVGAVFVDLVHGSLESHGLLRQVLQVLGALLGLLVRLAHLWTPL